MAVAPGLRTNRRPTLDIQNAEVDADGMRDFYWPLPLDVSVPVREFLYARLVPLVRESDPQDPQALTLRVTHQYLIMSALRLFEATALVAAFVADGVRPDVPPRFTMLRAVLNGTAPPLEILPPLTASPPSSPFPGWLRRTVRGVQWNQPSLTGMLRASLHLRGAGDLVTPHVNSLLVDHARRQGRVLRFSPLADWFEAMPRAEGDRLRAQPLSSVLCDAADLVSESFVAGGIKPQERVREWTANWLREADAFVQFHANELRKRQLPQEMWFSCTGAMIWSRILALAVRENGGYVASHDHGYGNAQIEQSGHHFTEFHFSDEFHTYNQLQAYVRRREVQQDLLLDPSDPVITAPLVGESRVPGPGEGRTLTRRGPIRRLLYVPTAFHGMRVRLRPIFPDPVALDFQARLFGRLRKLGIELLYKPHPGGASRPPTRFAEQFGFETDERRFEQLDWDCDAYLVDFLSSSTTRAVLSSERPVIFLAMPYPELLQDARALLERRCTFVDIEPGPDNRLHADWATLESTLNADLHEFEMTFPDAYYQGTDL